ncbi:hypothetical protein [Williamsia maris]|uniref:Major facilitator superfamily (MFS) profile domain-containing protein n=1 Tax=Williamsia maris TaxID=72806 RepID=A0ABT1HCM0_9NOCA|nr:hypothetical protein [Williamsia maris]MCP2175914.1 hypothetical protein [Williamsia maris]
MSTDNEIPAESRPQGWRAALRNVLYASVGLVGGWFIGLAVFFAGRIGVSVLNLRPSTGDIASIIGMAVWTVVAWVGAFAIDRYRRRWLVLFVAFAVGTSLLAAFAIVVAIPFGASMRDFD